MIRILVLTLLLSGCSTLERISVIPDIEIQTHTAEYTSTHSTSKTEESILEADKPIIEEVKEKTTTATQPPNAWLVFLALILISIGITTLSLKEFNVKKKTTIGR